MPYCSNCGREVGANIKFCPHCGAAQTANGPRTTEAAPMVPRGPPRPAIASLLIICYVGLGIVFLFLGAETLFIGVYFTAEVLAIALFIFLGTGVLALLTVYGFLKGGRWAPLYITVTGIFEVGGGALLAISSSLLLLALGTIAILLGVATLVYLRFGNVTAYLSR